MKVKVNIKPLNATDFINQEIKSITELGREHTLLLADATKIEMDAAIEQTRERESIPTSHLKEAITVEPIENGHGVGNIQTLNKQAPYWHWINYGVAQSGRRIPPGTKDNPRIKGHFKGDKSRFNKEQPKFAINPKKPITAKNYIEKSLSKVLIFIDSILRGMK
jgi:hypothetical protein